MVRDTIKPDITMFLHYETIYENEKKIVVVDIQRGTDRPYYIAKKGATRRRVCPPEIHGQGLTAVRTAGDQV